MYIDFEQILNDIKEGIYITDINRKIIYWNKGAEEITGYKKEEILNLHCYDNLLIHVDSEGCNLCKGMCPLAATMKDGKCRNVEIYLHHKNGHRKPVMVRTIPLKDKEEKIYGCIELFTESTNEKAFTSKIKELEKLAYIDTLSELPNRRFAEKQIETKLYEHERLGIPFGILFLDIDHFKSFNDNYGHIEGDRILKVVANTLKSNTRPYDIYSRWGGEEFVGIITGVNIEDLKPLANRMRVLVKSSGIYINNKFLNITVSIGGSISLIGDDLKSLIRRADESMYSSKINGGDRITVKA